MDTCILEFERTQTPKKVPWLLGTELASAVHARLLFLINEFRAPLSASYAEDSTAHAIRLIQAHMDMQQEAWKESDPQKRQEMMEAAEMEFAERTRAVCIEMADDGNHMNAYSRNEALRKIMNDSECEALFRASPTKETVRRIRTELARMLRAAEAPAPETPEDKEGVVTVVKIPTAKTAKDMPNKTVKPTAPFFRLVRSSD